LSAQLKLLPPRNAVVNESIGWVNDDILLLSLSLSAVLTKSLKSIATPLIFQSMQLECVPRVEASANFVQSSRVFIPSLDSLCFTEPDQSRPSQHSSFSGASNRRATNDSVLQHPHVQHKNALSLRSFDVLEWLQLTEQQLEAACSFETAEIPHALSFQESNRPPKLRHWSAKEKWKLQMRGGTHIHSKMSAGRQSLLFEDVDFLMELNTTKKIDPNAINLEEKASFDPLQLVSRMSFDHNKLASSTREHDEKVMHATAVFFF
jgi:hypothetical protein